MLDMANPIKKLLSKTSELRDNEDGAVSVDWVVLTGAIVGIAAAGGIAAKDGVTALGGSIKTTVSTKFVDNGN